MRCDLCGSEENLFKAIVEGAELNTCQKCSKFGKVLRRISPERKVNKPQSTQRIEIVKKTAPEELLVENYSQLIRSSRERMGLKQEELAKKISEKESLLHNFETGKTRPSLKTAKKLEKFFKIELIEEVEKKAFQPQKSTNGPITIGDMIKIRKR